MEVSLSVVLGVFGQPRMAAGLDAARCPLPGGEDLGGGGHKRSLPSGLESPPKRSGGDGLVRMGVLRQLLADQAAMTWTMSWKGEMRRWRPASRVEDRLTSQAGAIQEVKAMVEEMRKQGSSRQDMDGSTMASERHGGDRYRLTLVWGGWARDPPSDHPHRRSWGPGQARRGIRVGLRPGRLGPGGWWRSATSFTGIGRRGRECTEWSVPFRREIHGWALSHSGAATVGRPRNVGGRRRAGHACLVKRLVKDHYPQELERLDVEFSTGTAWIGDSRVSSSIDAKPEGQDQDYYVVLTKPERPWINVRLLGRELGASLERVRTLLADAERR